MDAILRRVLANLDTPADLTKVVRMALLWEGCEDLDIAAVRAAMWSSNPNAEVFVAVSKRLRQWDCAEHLPWVGDTMCLTAERRERVYSLLELAGDERGWCEERVPVFKLERPVVIAEDHEFWYTAERKTKCEFYWQALSGQLRRQGWDEDSLAALDLSSTRVVERLSDPCRDAVHKTKGLVVGHVQSGKTANFTGVIAKAADAGYRLIVVLAGTWNMLRAQTQRRLDKDVIGWELLEGDYDQEPKDEQDSFLHHGRVPSVLGAFDWQRLTDQKDDYHRLKHGLSTLGFTARDPKLAYWSWENLSKDRARLIVIKKNPKVLARLIADLTDVEKRCSAGAVTLDAVPMLLIDDESDQAGVNTKAPTPAQQKDRTATNKAITDLLTLFKRGQYIGYTATPFANVFIDPDDAEDLFPRDYLLCLPRPAGYMGVSDFHDFDGRPDGMASNERAFIRPVVGTDSDNLPSAIDAFVLAGAVKLWRQSKDPGLARRYRHHTMLVHTDVAMAAHTVVAAGVADIFDDAAYDQPRSLVRLERLWREDFLPVCLARADGLPVPMSFGELRTHIGQACANIQRGGSVVLVVNGDAANIDDTPDFDHQPVWKVIVGGNKLSRGYTIEGLTVSYYRRKSSTADTLMQMGRWFGYRRGYRDLVRVFLGRQEPNGRQAPVDLYQLFEAVCRDEELFRADLQKYAAMRPVRIRPIDVPPLVPSHLLRPTTKNKMFNATIQQQNFGGLHVEPTAVPAADTEQGRYNLALTEKLIVAAAPRLHRIGVDGGGFDAYLAEVTKDQFVEFLAEFEFSGDDKKPERLVRFLRNGDGLGDNGICRWLIMLPQVAGASPPWQVGSIALSVAERSRVGGPADRFKVFSTPRHLNTAKYLAGIKTTQRPVPVGATSSLVGTHAAVLVMYPVRSQPAERISIGYAAVFPENNIATPIVFGVRVPAAPTSVVVQV